MPQKGTGKGKNAEMKEEILKKILARPNHRDKENRKGEGDDDKTLIRFLDPPTVRGTAVLTHEATGRADDATAMRQIRLALFPEN